MLYTCRRRHRHVYSQARTQVNLCRFITVLTTTHRTPLCTLCLYGKYFGTVVDTRLLNYPLGTNPHR